MCGIFGMVLSPGQKPDPILVKKATDILIHRGPDSGGYFIENNLALGNRRLAILDLSDLGQQPFSQADLTITYNGELYNYLEVRKELEALGHSFCTQTDTEVILLAYQQWGKSCVHRFNGMWAFAIYDSRHQILFCSRDRFGIKPFYYSLQNKAIAFASEIKALCILPDWNPKLNTEMASDWLIQGLQNHTNQTLFKSVQQLAAGHQMTIDLSNLQIQIEQYYDLKKIQLSQAYTLKQASQKFRELLSDAIRLHIRSDVKVGAALSGGLDSSTLVALLYPLFDCKEKHLEIVSYASEIPKFDESQFVKSLLKKYPVNVHWTSGNFEETINLLDEVILAHDEPLLSSRLVAQYKVFQTAKANGITVMLDGQGADELLAGYGTYYLPLLKEIGWRHPFQFLKEGFGLLEKHQIKWHKKLNFFKSPLDLASFIKSPESDFKLKTNSFLDYSHFMIQKGILPSLLQFDDRNSMAHSVESRLPFLDYRFVEFCMSLPADFKIRNGVRKFLLRKSMKGFLPEKILKRYDKMGFTTPEEQWMDENPDLMKKLIAETIGNHPTLFESSLLPFVSKVLEQKQKEHYSFLWRLSTFGRWMQLYQIRN